MGCRVLLGLTFFLFGYFFGVGGGWVLFCVWSCMSCLRLYEVDDDAYGDVDAADFNVADDQAAGVGDAVDDVLDDDKDADGDISITTM